MFNPEVTLEPTSTGPDIEPGYSPSPNRPSAAHWTTFAEETDPSPSPSPSPSPKP